MLIQTTRLEHRTKSSNKFWEITVDIKNRKYTVTFGKIGTKGRTIEYGPLSVYDLLVETSKKIKDKMDKGYKQVLVNSPEVAAQTLNDMPAEDLLYVLDFDD